MSRKDTKLFLGHKVHIGVDGGEDTITSVTTTTGTIRESRICAALLSRHMDALKNVPAEVVADKWYSSRRLYKHLLDMGIKPSIPKARPWKRPSRKQKEAGLKYDPERGVYICPAGKTMCQLKDAGNRKLYQAHGLAGKDRPNSGSLCKARRPTITRPLDEESDERVWEHLSTYQAKQSIRQRKVWPETVFGELENARGMSKARLRGISNVQTEALMAATAHNTLKMARRFMKAAEAKASKVSLSVAACYRSYLGLTLVAV